MATDLELLFSKKAEEIMPEDVKAICLELRSKREQFAISEKKKAEPKPAKPAKAPKPTKEEALLASSQLSLDDLL